MKGGTPAPDLYNNPSECFASTSIYTRMNKKACIYTIFKVITQSEILALSIIRAKRKNGVPEKYCKANFFWGGGETNEANLKGLLANLFLLRNLFGRAGVPPTTLLSSLFTIHCVKVSFTLTVPFIASEH